MLPNMHALQADVPTKCNMVRICQTRVSVGCMHDRLSLMECGMHYGKPSKMECEYHAYVCKYSQM